MDPSIASHRINMRLQLLRDRKKSKVKSMITAQVAAVLVQEQNTSQQDAHDKATQLIDRQIAILEKQQPHLFDRGFDFVGSVIFQRVKAVIHEESARKAAEDERLAQTLNNTDAPGRRLAETLANGQEERLKKLQRGFELVDFDRSGSLMPEEIRTVCREHCMETASFGEIIACCGMGRDGRISFMEFLDRLASVEFPGIVPGNNPASDEGGQQDDRSRRRYVKDGANWRVKPMPINEWASITQQQVDASLEYEQMAKESARRSNIEFGKSLWRLSENKKNEAHRRLQQEKRREREEVDAAIQIHQQTEEEERRASYIKRMENAAVGRRQIQDAKERRQRQRKEMLEWDREQVRKNQAEEEAEQIRRIEKQEKRRSEWRQTMRVNEEERKAKELAAIAEANEDKRRMEEYAEKLDLEHARREAELQKKLNYKPPESTREAALQITELARQDEMRAFRAQREEERKQRLADEQKAMRRKQEALELADFHRRQMAEKYEKDKEEKVKDREEVEKLMAEVEKSMRAERDAEDAQREKRIQLMRDQQIQCKLRQRRNEAEVYMSPRERALNTDLMMSMSPRSEGSPLASTGRRLLG